MTPLEMFHPSSSYCNSIRSSKQKEIALIEEALTPPLNTDHKKSASMVEIFLALLRSIRD